MDRQKEFHRKYSPFSLLKNLFLANLPSIQFMRLVNASWTIDCASFITTTIDSLYFPLVALFFISPLWKLLLLELFNLISIDKKNSFTALQSFINTLDFDWSFSRPMKLSVSFVDAHRCINSVGLDFYFILTISLDKCMTKKKKSFKVNTLLLAILVADQAAFSKIDQRSIIKFLVLKGAKQLKFVGKLLLFVAVIN